MKRDHNLCAAIEFITRTLREEREKSKPHPTCEEKANAIEEDCHETLRIIAWWDESATLEEFDAKFAPPTEIN